MRRLSFRSALSVMFAFAALAACKKDKHDDGGGGGSPGPNGGPGGPQQQGTAEASTVQADFGGAVGVLVLDLSGGDGAALTGGYGLQGGEAGGEDSFKKIKEDGDIASVFNIKKPAGGGGGPGGPGGQFPKIKTIAVSPLKEIYLHFENPFIFKSQTEPQFLPRPECQPGGQPSGDKGPEGGGGEGAPPPEGGGLALQEGGGGEGGGGPGGPAPGGSGDPAGNNCQGPGEENPNWKDPWKMENGFQCQIFKVMGGTIDDLTASAPLAEGASNLDCLDSGHFIDSWQANRNSVFQFDNEGNVYYPGSTPSSGGGGGRMVVYRHAPNGEITEMINSNICVQDFLVTQNGGIFYTGSSDCAGGGGGGGGFFRYVASGGDGLREIARDWWNFVFEAETGGEGDKAVFFGPDPRSATTASWNSACLFRYDPSAGTTADKTIKEVITCGSDIWSWINMTRGVDKKIYGLGYEEDDRTPKTGWAPEFRKRCESKGQVFAGGGSQINAIQQDSDGKIYVIGQVRKKREGKVSCNIQIKGPHCADKDKIPHLPTEEGWETSTACTDAGGVWDTGTQGHCEGDYSSNSGGTRWISATSSDSCLGLTLAEAGDLISETVTEIRWVYEQPTTYNNVASPGCSGEGQSADLGSDTVASHSDGSTVTDDVEFHTDWMQCQPVAEEGEELSGNGGDQWLTEYKGLAEVDAASKSLILRSDTDEQAIKLWLINDVPYYSSYNTAEGRYFLKRYKDGKAETVRADFETYNLSESNSSKSMFYDGLDFKTNVYEFGSADVATKEFTPKEGLQGQVKTIVALPKSN